MALEFPSWLEWLEWVVGSDWPHGNEDLMWQMGYDFEDVAKDVDKVVDELDTLMGNVRDAYPDGTGGEEILAWLTPLRDGEGPEKNGSLSELATNYRSLAKAADNLGDELQAAKLNFYIAGAWLIAELTWAAATGPAAPAAEAAALASGRTLFRMLSKQFIRRIVSNLRRLVTREVLKELLPKLVREIAQEAGEELLQGTSQEALVQAIQVNSGHKDGYDSKALWNNAAISTIAGGAGGATGFGMGRALPTNMGGLQGLSRGAMTGLTAGSAGAGAAWLSNGLINNSWEFDPRSLTGGALSGVGPSAIHGYRGSSDFAGGPQNPSAGGGPETRGTPGSTQNAPGATENPGHTADPAQSSQPNGSPSESARTNGQDGHAPGDEGQSAPGNDRAGSPDSNSGAENSRTAPQGADTGSAGNGNSPEARAGDPASSPNSDVDSRSDVRGQHDGAAVGHEGAAVGNDGVPVSDGRSHDSAPGSDTTSGRASDATSPAHANSADTNGTTQTGAQGIPANQQSAQPVATNPGATTASNVSAAPVAHSSTPNSATTAPNTTGTPTATNTPATNSPSPHSNTSTTNQGDTRAGNPSDPAKAAAAPREIRTDGHAPRPVGEPRASVSNVAPTSASPTTPVAASRTGSEAASDTKSDSNNAAGEQHPDPGTVVPMMPMVTNPNQDGTAPRPRSNNAAKFGPRNASTPKTADPTSSQPDPATRPPHADHTTRSDNSDPSQHGPADHHDGDPLQSGGAMRPRNVLDIDGQRAWADNAYEAFRASESDVDDMHRNLVDVERLDGTTGFSREELGRVKEHLFDEEHLLDVFDSDGNVVGHETRRYDSDADIAEAWMRLSRGVPLQADITLLEHELAESAYLRQHPDATYREAHEYADSKANWVDVLPPRTGENYERWAENDGSVHRVPQGDGDPDLADVPVREQSEQPRQTGDDQYGRPGHQSGGRLESPGDEGRRPHSGPVQDGRDLAGRGRDPGLNAGLGDEGGGRRDGDPGRTDSAPQRPSAQQDGARHDDAAQQPGHGPQPTATEQPRETARVDRSDIDPAAVDQTYGSQDPPTPAWLDNESSEPAPRRSLFRRMLDFVRGGSSPEVDSRTAQPDHDPLATPQQAEPQPLPHEPKAPALTPHQQNLVSEYANTNNRSAEDVMADIRAARLTLDNTGVHEVGPDHVGPAARVDRSYLDTVLRDKIGAHGQRFESLASDQFEPGCPDADLPSHLTREIPVGALDHSAVPVDPKLIDLSYPGDDYNVLWRDRTEASAFLRPDNALFRMDSRGPEIFDTDLAPRDPRHFNIAAHTGQTAGSGLVSASKSPEHATVRELGHLRTELQTNSLRRLPDGNFVQTRYVHELYTPHGIDVDATINDARAVDPRMWAHGHTEAEVLLPGGVRSDQIYRIWPREVIVSPSGEILSTRIGDPIVNPRFAYAQDPTFHYTHHPEQSVPAPENADRTGHPDDDVSSPVRDSALPPHRGLEPTQQSPADPVDGRHPSDRSPAAEQLPHSRELPAERAALPRQPDSSPHETQPGHSPQNQPTQQPDANQNPGPRARPVEQVAPQQLSPQQQVAPDITSNQTTRQGDQLHPAQQSTTPQSSAHAPTHTETPTAHPATPNQATPHPDQAGTTHQAPVDPQTTHHPPQQAPGKAPKPNGWPGKNIHNADTSRNKLKKWVRFINGPGLASLGRNINCVLCSDAFLRTWFGHPTEAPALTGPSGTQGLGPAAVDNLTGGRRVPADFQGIKNRLLQMGSGSAAMVLTDWVDANGRRVGGHAFVAVNHNGKILFVDAQTGQVHGWPPKFRSEGVGPTQAVFLNSNGRPLHPLGVQPNTPAGQHHPQQHPAQPGTQYQPQQIPVQHQPQQIPAQHQPQQIPAQHQPQQIPAQHQPQQNQPQHQPQQNPTQPAAQHQPQQATAQQSPEHHQLTPTQNQPGHTPTTPSAPTMAEGAKRVRTALADAVDAFNTPARANEIPHLQEELRARLDDLGLMDPTTGEANWRAFSQHDPEVADYLAEHHRALLSDTDSTTHQDPTTYGTPEPDPHASQEPKPDPSSAKSEPEHERAEKQPTPDSTQPGNTDHDQATVSPDRDTPSQAANPSEPTPISPQEIESVHGIPEENQRRIQDYADEHGLIIDVRPTNPDAVRHLQNGAMPKPMDIKDKTINDNDILLGAPEHAKGLVGRLNPESLSMPDTTGMSQQQIDALKKRLEDRRKDWGAYEEHMDELIAAKEFRVTDEGIVEGKVGDDWKPVTGDHDLFDIRHADGTRLTPEELDQHIARLIGLDAGIMHGPHAYWEPATEFQRQRNFEPIVNDHQYDPDPNTKNEPLIRFSPNEDPVATWADKDLAAIDREMAPWHLESDLQDLADTAHQRSLDHFDETNPEATPDERADFDEKTRRQVDAEIDRLRDLAIDLANHPDFNHDSYRAWSNPEVENPVDLGSPTHQLATIRQAAAEGADPADIFRSLKSLHSTSETTAPHADAEPGTATTEGKTPKEIAQERVDMANDETSTWFKDHYDKRGYRRNVDKLIDGYPLPQLRPDPKRPGKWISAEDAPPPLPKKFKDSPTGAPDGSTKTLPAAVKQDLDAIAKERRGAIDLDQPLHAPLEQAKKDFKAAKARLQGAEQSLEAENSPDSQREHDLAKADRDRTEADLDAKKEVHREPHAKVTKLGEKMGEHAAERHAVPEHFPGATRVELPDLGFGQRQFDQVFRLPDGTYVVVEAKGPSAELGACTLPNGQRVQQGRLDYFEAILDAMEERGQEQNNGEDDIAAELRAALRNGRLEYVLVQAAVNGDVYSGYDLKYFDLDREAQPGGYQGSS
ncbi:toxin glutamine deamidase domain-containing protein [Nocardia jejuensis]|uniref:WXG100-like domain-containing protein n=1 Tax=Nocardia jejuensis TaxID=328049 RepID=UPI000835872B|nr:toxin glutamine deamidase domain-containing protein [Nocardia jejuensis]